MPGRYRAATIDEVEEFFRHRLTQEDTVILLAEEDAVPVGYAVVSRADFAGHILALPRRAAEVHDLGVTAAARRRGIGRALVAAAEAQARAWGASELVLTVIGFNEDARRFYQALGYETLLTRLARPL